MAFSEGLSDTGELTGRGSPSVRGAITGRRDVPRRHPAHAAVPDHELPRGRGRRPAIVVAFELVALAVIRWRFFETGFLKSLLAISFGGAVIAVVGALIGSAG